MATNGQLCTSVVPREPLVKIRFFGVFLLIFFYWYVVWSRFFYWRKQLGWADLSDTLNMFVKSIENFLETFEKKVSAPKMGVCQNIPTWFWASYFQNLNFFHFSRHIIRLVRRVLTSFLLTQRDLSGGPFHDTEIKQLLGSSRARSATCDLGFISPTAFSLPSQNWKYQCWHVYFIEKMKNIHILSHGRVRRPISLSS